MKILPMALSAAALIVSIAIAFSTIRLLRALHAR